MGRVLANWELDFPVHSSTVQVSIVICAYNKSDYTLKCLSAVCESLKFNMTQVEVILVDDCSTDNTQEIFANVRGLNYLRNENNLGFLKSANRGALAAQGQYVLFLNNDTLPIGNWLDPLVDRMKTHTKIGAVGSKLLNDDGSVQEAGGIIFADGSGWNYGRGWDATDPRINYARSVDYCSGAALLVKADLLKEIGGFDTSFAPAYYEDTDLCFQIRELGYSVWYEPNSVIIHYEGVSHGKDTSSGIKSVQEINRGKFQSKWHAALAEHFPNNPNLVHLAANRHYTSRILLVDHQIPTPDQDSGSLRIYELIKAMVELNCFVTFLIQNGLQRQIYTENLLNLGVEVLPATSENLELLFQRNNFYEAIWTSRPEPTTYFFSELRSHFAYVPVIYDTVDLHFLRMRRSAQLQSTDVNHIDSLRMEVNELELIEKSDKVVVVSDYEESVLKPLTNKPIYLIPNVHIASEYSPGPQQRSGILFVGGFAHQPNEDAISWFIKEIFPQILKEESTTKLQIVGANPPKWLLELNHPNIDVLGWVPELRDIYAKARVCIAPLRFGAGVKGKVGEALSYRVPIVLTDIAAEGLGLTANEHCLIANEPTEFANACLELLSNNQVWRTTSINGYRHITENFGKATTLKRVKELLEI